VRRFHLFEFHDLEAFPSGWRDQLTDFLSFFFKTFKPYECVAPILAEALEKSSAVRIVDLCSGAGQPVLSVLPALRRAGYEPGSIVLTDKFPNHTAFDEAESGSAGLVSSIREPVDATAVPPDLAGFRTLFTSFHHFDPKEARKVLRAAEHERGGIGVFEFTERNLLLWTIPVLLIPLLVWVCTPFIRPFTWRRIFWTYVIPVVPLVAMWDGAVSNLRTYSVHELRHMTSLDDDTDYEWRIGQVRSLGLSRVTYAVGLPRATGENPEFEPRSAS
jgi:hypothetical protein